MLKNSADFQLVTDIILLSSLLFVRRGVAVACRFGPFMAIRRG